MLRFRVGSIPVEVHFSHLAFSALIALYGGWIPPHDPTAPWPHGAQPGSTAYLQATFLYVCLWIGIVFVSVLVHELGHATTARLFGYRPSIRLIWMGGDTRPNANETIPWHRDLALTAAGPLFGALLGLVCLGLNLALKPGGLGGYALQVTAIANLFWTIVNLIPVGSFDGGRIANTVLTRLFGNAGFVIAQVLSLLLAGAGILFGALTRQPFLAAVFGLMAVSSISLIAAYLRGELHPGRPTHPAELALAKAEQLYHQGRLAESKALCEAVMATDIAPALVSKGHWLLGWIALKNGEGRPALDHFSQVSRQKVEQAGLAAAFSLVGDDHRAVALWERALHETPSPTVLHEYAGALIRDGRIDDARRLPGVQLSQAFACAERVLFLRGEFSAAGEMGERALAETEPASASGSATTAYDAACAYARAGRVDDALRLLEGASERGFHDPAYAESDSDLGALHGDPRFHAWLAALRGNSMRLTVR